MNTLTQLLFIYPLFAITFIVQQNCPNFESGYISQRPSKYSATVKTLQ